MPITVVLGTVRYQRCALVQTCAEKLKIELLFLPTYSPNLNLIERLWKFVKKQCLYAK
ncbi:MAG: transposase [Candidatus Accumulibacter sp.]|uniref:Transposase n=1 Tax=Candidatus Accumulibacter affinis TaxID=2954384 RepID=A0A935T982_9PROT|nr:transposase [Candidatus Accumulibacter affinis]